MTARLLHQAAQKAVGAALRRAYSLGQIYWRLADSDSYLKNAKASTTQKQFDALVQETLATIQKQPEPVARSAHMCGMQGFDGMLDICPACEARRAPPALQHQEVPREPVAKDVRVSDFIAGAAWHMANPDESLDALQEAAEWWATEHASPSTTRQQEVGSADQGEKR